MRIREVVTTTATPERAWELISDLSRHGEWNSHVVATELFGSGPPGIGLRYRITYELSGKTSEFEAEITEFSPPARFAVRLEERNKGDGRHMGRFMVESYDLSPHGARTRVIHEVHVHQSGINILLRILIWLIMHFGKPTGQTIMEKFGLLAESEDAPARTGTR